MKTKIKAKIVILIVLVINLTYCQNEKLGINIINFNKNDVISITNPFKHITYKSDNEDVERFIKLINSLDKSDITVITEYDSSLVTGYVDFTVDKGDILDMISVQSLSDGSCVFRWVAHDSRTETQTTLHFFKFTDLECTLLIAKIQKFYGYNE